MNVQNRIADLNKTLAELRETLAGTDDASSIVDDLNYAADHFDLSVRLFEDALGRAHANSARETVETILEAQNECLEDLIAEDLREKAS